MRRPAVADPVGEHLGAVEVAEGDVVDAVEHAGRHAGHAADADVALGLAGLAAGHEGVGEHHRPGAGGADGQVAAYALHGGRERGLVGPGGQLPGLGEGQRVEVGQAVDRDRPVVVGQPRRAMPTLEASVRMKTPAASISRELNPRRCAESWLPLVSTTWARERASRTSDSSASRTASTWGRARS